MAGRRSVTAGASSAERGRVLEKATSTQVVYELTTTRSVFSLRAERGGELQGRP